MQLPFSLDEFLGAFRAYNEAIGIAPIVLTALAIGLVAVAQSAKPWRHRVVAFGLALLWIWSGIVYHWTFFSDINPAARIFGAVFVAQGILLLFHGGIGRQLRIGPRGGAANVFGWILVVYALLVYPLLGRMFGHGYPAGPSFGTPCPTTIFFFGIVFWTLQKIPVALVVLPILWAAIGMSAALQLGIREDFGLTVGAILLVAEIVRQRAHNPRRPVVATGSA